MKQNKNFKVNGAAWAVVIAITVSTVALFANTDIMVTSPVLPAPLLDEKIDPVPTVRSGKAAVPESSGVALSMQEEINQVVAKVRPAVVSIITKAPVKLEAPHTGLDFIDSHAGNRGKVGSGIIIDPAGYVLTTFQAVGKEREVKVGLFSAGRRELDAVVAAVDPDTDLVLLRITEAGPFPSVALGDSDGVEIGDLVFALGSPYGFSRSVTMGIVSTHRKQMEIDGIRYPDLIQTDASLNPGENGGPLVNISGEVIGINAAYYAPGNHYTGIGFAVPVNSSGPILGAGIR